MTTYAIGDIQGCAKSLDRLLEAISFDPARDHLWLTGDLVNRGPDSLGVLRRLLAMEGSVTSVLGNHDLHLLAAAAGVREPAAEDTLQPVLEAPDSGQLIDWLRQQPLLHYDPTRDQALVHAGVPPNWSVHDALTHASEVERLLAGPTWKQSLRTMYGDEPNIWEPSLDQDARRRYSINALTRIRYCDAHGRLDFTNKGPPGSQPATLTPWYEFPRPDDYATHIVFGHWASLGLLRQSTYTCLDSGCVWGRRLTALPLDPLGEPVSIPCAEETS